MPPTSDLVRLSELETHFSPDPSFTKHVYNTSGRGQRSVRQEEQWKRQRQLGRGSFGAVYLERCMDGHKKGKLRAVKEIQKSMESDYYRELEAIALFSHQKYKHCFVTSFGWYKNDNNIFIAMQYLPAGDLHQYLGSPLPEQEGLLIVSQILEGLGFMHGNGFAHRDLKPSNILVVSKGPEWWVKIADFGISKRATEGLTALRTLTGTPAFAAPEVLGYIEVDDGSYTNAVDLWSTGVITFLILTGESFFKDQRRLGQYAAGRIGFPIDALLTRSISTSGCEFVKSLMAPNPQDRPGVKAALHHDWFTNKIEAPSSMAHRTLNIQIPEPIVDLPNTEPSAAWTTQEKSSTLNISRLRDPESRNSSSTQEELNHDLSDSPSASSEGNAICQGHQSSTLTKTRTSLRWTRIKQLKGHKGLVRGVAFSPDGKLVASCSDDTTVRLWDVATGAEVKRLEGHDDWVYKVAFSPDGKLVASCSDDTTVRLWDWKSLPDAGQSSGFRKQLRNLFT